MKPLFFKQKFLLAVVLLLSTAFSAKAGLDSYEIYLNDRLILKQYVNQPLSLESLALNQSNINDRLVIYYSQCNAPGKIGKSRTLLIKDATGKIVKQWKFADANSGRSSMVIAVKDLLELDKKTGGALTLYYVADGRPDGQLLTNLRLGAKTTTYRPRQSTPDIAFLPFTKAICL